MNDESRPAGGPQSRATHRTRSAGGALRKARAEALFGLLDGRHGKALDDGLFEQAREYGLSKADVDKAIDDLVAAGRLVLSASGGQVYFETIKQAA